MLPRQGVTPELARFIVDTKWDDLPEKARHEAKRALLNFFAVAIAGCRTQPVELALRTLGEFSGGRQATIVGRPERIDPLTAAFLNAAGANVFDYCDTHLPTVVHPTSPLAPALLALSEIRKVTGPELLLAFALGFEIECRVGGAVSPGHYPKGWHITSTCGVFGSAAGATKLLGLDVERTVWALGSASTQSAGLCECLGWPAKSVSVGNAARNGLFSALLAEKGFAGPPEPIAGAQGFLAAMGEPPDWKALLDGLGEDWQVNHNSIKPYAAGFVIHPLLDLALDWRRAHPDGQVERIAVRGNPLLLQRTDRADIATGREAQVSLQHCVAAALVLGKAGLDQLTDACVADPAIKALRLKFECSADDRISTIAAEMDIWTTDGKKHPLSTQAARGSSSNPLKDSEIEAKLRDEARRWEPDHDIQPLIDAVWALDGSEDVSSLLALAVPTRR
ncbi:MAG: MmgE/PrpD family protein [Reyranella sp.]|uniref:MmgE/PrpD family protein n=1 Tax=Reyranella sp. TaxID=1929291 RepID=UPI0011F93E37|nr:MmgE/PrpD family protein [Reyranella sp.]TAJ89116.1 MAG: MmgE/PrpD family protein [Reyranella sp.]TBR30668.1 MAG: MmgE/PrpD family protein [Reyranella sp.]